ncbi:MAG: hypothetical protein IJW03_04525 [Clostridia bacterium]|nr:hypothetical protein [Clostridia bacterium]
MNKIKTVICIIASLLVILLPLLIVATLMVTTPAQYSETFYGALGAKFDRLTSIEEDKIIVVGGSSVAFGLDSELLEEYTDRPCVNFGLYAALGTKLMLDLSRAGVSEGDIVVLAPELDAQTLSMYFSSESTLQAFDGRYDMARYVRGDSRLSLLGGMYKHTAEKLAYYKNGNAPSPVGVYRSDSFNEYCDIEWERRENVMPYYYDPNTIVTLDESIVEDEFIDYLNEYIRFCERRGATVYFSYCPTNAMALAEGTDKETISAFENYLKDNIECEFISFLEDYIMEAGYFYDTNFHLNDAGVTVRTLKLAEDIRIAEGNPTKLDVEYPKAPELPMADMKFDGDDENTKYFTFEQQANGGMKITGLTELGRTMETLTVPLGYEGFKVTSLGREALSGSAATKLIITEDTNLRNLLDGAFDGSSITDIYIYYVYEDEADILSPCSDFLGINVHVYENSPYTYTYSWDGQNAKNKNIITDLGK